MNELTLTAPTSIILCRVVNYAGIYQQVLVVCSVSTHLKRAICQTAFRGNRCSDKQSTETSLSYSVYASIRYFQLIFLCNYHVSYLYRTQYVICLHFRVRPSAAHRFTWRINMGGFTSQ